MSRKPRFLALIALLSIAMAGCVTENPTGVNGAPTTDDALNAKPRRANPASNTGTVTVVHGVPGLTVDVYVNGALTLPGFQPGTVTAPIELAEGDYDLAVVPQGGSFPADVAISGSATLPAGANASIVAHLSETGTPTLAVFVNDVSPVAGNRSRVVVRHVAAAPAVDVRFFRPPHKRGAVLTVEDLANAGEAQADVRKRPYWATISPANSPDVLFTTPKINVNRARSYIVYAYGSLADGTFAIATQTIELPKQRGRR